MSLARAAAVIVLVVVAGWLGMQAGSWLVPATSAEPEAFEAPTHGGAEPSARANLAGPSATFRGSRALDPRVAEPSLAERNRLAIEHLEEGELERAIELFGELTEADPSEPVFARNLAEALSRQAFRRHTAGDAFEREAALEGLERAVELDPTREDLASLLERWRRSAAAEEGFWHKITDHFELSFDGTRDELMWGTTPLENELENAYHEFGELFGFFPVEGGRARIRVVLYQREDFDSVTGLGDWAGGVFDGTVRVPVEDLGRELHRLKGVLRHELAHAFVEAAGGSRVPGWLNEGLAQLLEPPFQDERLSPIARARAKLQGRPLFGLDELGGSLAAWKDREAIELAYAQSLALVAWIEKTYGERVLVEMVAECARGVTPGETFERRVGVRLDVVLEDMARGL